MVTIKQTERGWEVRIGRVLYGIYQTETEAATNATGMDRDWN